MLEYPSLADLALRSGSPRREAGRNHSLILLRFAGEAVFKMGEPAPAG